MLVKVLFFGMVKDLVGRAEDCLEMGPHSRLTAVFDHYAGLHPRLREMAGSIVLARNQEFADPQALVSDGDEIAFLPPVSGGSAPMTAEHRDGQSREEAAIETIDQGNYFAIVRGPVHAGELAARLHQPSDGAVVTFEGVTRNNSGGRATRYLEYECYLPLALKKMRDIGLELVQSHAIARIGIVHRLGRLEIGETSVAIVATAAHRKPAYEASLEAIDRLKRLVPIWKKEFFIDGEVWVEGEWDASAPRLEGTPRCAG